ncbi:hypothetical protein [Falsiroseomonas selenitidurans]|uniref:Uncharacterized protein n=1 Tax=Falsiroseomonas selenitidurans TaxID=2716335 RepID=A0ABX1DXS9_9PROT|nr:hypothetical protein [Falsiroseomonas selenitidurans]NKC29679.1 hypothetical protein [Falsiroseomonas selenitidurans]
MNSTEPCGKRWDLDYLMPELPAQGRWQGGPMNQRLRPGREVMVWHPGDGNLGISATDGVATLRLEDTDRTLEQILAAIRPDPGSPAPRAALGEIELKGVKGTLTLGEEVIRFAGLQRIVIWGYSAYPARDGR